MSELEDMLRGEIRSTIESVAIEWEAKVKETISDKAVDTGEFLNSIHYEIFENKNEISFIGYDGVNYGKYYEYGTKSHFIPFYKYLGKDGDGNSMYDGNTPILADWGRRVLGLSKEEMLERGGMKVKTPALHIFFKSLEYAKGEIL